MKIIFERSHFFGAKSGSIKKLPLMLASHAFLVMLALILVDLVAGIVLFYIYVVLAKSGHMDAVSQVMPFQYPTYQAVLKQWQTNQQDFKDFQKKTYLNPFK